ncbi:MAG: tRNA (guanosine(37)-N1)-methyltransferase TrmD [bacterium]
MQIDVITLFPQIFDVARENGITRVALDKGLIELGCYNPRDYTSDSYRTIDDRPYGGGPGMVMMAEPLAKCIDSVREKNSGPLVVLSPQGERLDQSLVTELAAMDQLAFLCGRYEGIDERIIDSRVDREISIGDYVVAGGEFPAMVLIEAITRLIPGVLGNANSVLEDSFANGLLDCPHYTRPEIFEQNEVPPVLLSGHHEQIAEWRLQQSLGRTWKRRPDLIRDRQLNELEQRLLKEFKLEQHDD